MNIWLVVPRALREFLLAQPLPEAWLAAIRASLEEHPDESARKELGLTWKRSHSMIAALIVLLFSAFIMYGIVA